jgi:hypothetical protein
VTSVPPPGTPAPSAAAPSAAAGTAAAAAVGPAAEPSKNLSTPGTDARGSDPCIDAITADSAYAGGDVPGHPTDYL